MTPEPRALNDDESRYPGWFLAFMADRAVRKPSPHTLKAYRQDFIAIATQLAAAPDRVAYLTPDAITRDAMQAAFAAYADTHEAASIRRCWSNWNTLCDFLYTDDLITANPMPLIGRPKVPKSLPKGLGAETVSGLLEAIEADSGSQRRSNWPERDAALVLTAVLAGLRADELLHADVGDIRATTEGGGVIQVRGKGNKDRRIPVEQGLIKVLECYLDSRAVRFPADTKRRGPSAGIGAWPATAALFVGSDGHRITRGVLQYRVLRAFKNAGLNGQRAAGALVHALRHTFATELANSDVNVYMLMKLLGHESMVTSQRYVDGAGTQNRAAAAQNPLYGLIKQSREP
ncbi:recombinase [Mycobacterium avium subsp. hominissuis]|uniref:Recombinase n=1 Tax=Mycobacterium avium subsp. hominissuis TaxID=439334 RepID=A0A2A3L4R0_MYCAV|nr:tyrosine-type recombinase/integrase [Mycobacterium avium]ATO67754.1 tyrosine-type recombinase/integrase [Mycobacterium avium subsp. hominissuis]PBJ31697.1 recombinase [Mycobacterium avium subsp. hominissuis]PBJ65911.1 recombinase [Mycobacterium avium subsp. hominissuis]QXD08200.1 tyrosine-type recombinase/integrase [Mycobacterium avium subsp. hominissuis]